MTKHDVEGRLILAGIAMSLALIFVLALSQATEATWEESAHIDTVVLEAVEVTLAGDWEAVTRSYALLAEIAKDPGTSAVCRVYADQAHATLMVGVDADQYPDSYMINEFASYLLTQLPIAQSRCQLGT